MKIIKDVAGALIGLSLCVVLALWPVLLWSIFFNNTNEYFLAYSSLLFVFGFPGYLWDLKKKQDNMIVIMCSAYICFLLMAWLTEIYHHELSIYFNVSMALVGEAGIYAFIQQAKIK